MGMHYLTAMLIVSAAAAGWTLVQRRWHRLIARAGDDADALAVRSAPGSCCFCTRPTCDRPDTASDDSHRENVPC